MSLSLMRGGVCRHGQGVRVVGEWVCRLHPHIMHIVLLDNGGCMHPPHYSHRDLTESEEWRW